MSQKRCFCNVLKCPKASSGSCELLGSYENEDEANECRVEKSKGMDDDHYIILIHKLEYDL
jgi:hypothetical protein